MFDTRCAGYPAAAFSQNLPRKSPKFGAIEMNILLGIFAAPFIVTLFLVLSMALASFVGLSPGAAMVTRSVREWCSAFDWAQVFTTTAGYKGWTIADTSSSGTPTYLTISGGGAALTCDTQNEAQNICLYQNNILPFNLLKIQRMEWLAKVPTTDAALTLFMGLGSSRNDAPDSLTTMVGFRIEGSVSTTNLLCESDDGVTDLDDKASGTTLATVFKKLVIDFTNGLSDIRFYVDGERVAASQTFSMAALTSATNVQPIFQLQKTASAAAIQVVIKDVKIVYTEAEGA